FHLLADQEPHHVQFMDRTVEVQIAPRLWAAVRARRIAADQMHNVRTADIAPLDRLTGVQERPIESAIEADLEVHLRALYCMQRPVCRSEVPVDWLFTKDMLPGPRRRLYDLRVRVSRYANQDRIDRSIGQQSWWSWYRLVAPYSSAQLPAFSRSRSAKATSSLPSMWRDRQRAWMRAITPAPISPIRTLP